MHVDQARDNEKLRRRRQSLRTTSCPDWRGARESLSSPTESKKTQFVARTDLLLKYRGLPLTSLKTGETSQDI